jgi:hypothetical protein
MIHGRYGCGDGGAAGALALSSAAASLAGASFGAVAGAGGEVLGGPAGAAGLPMPIRLWGCCASGRTSGPFCPQAGKAATQTTTSRPMMRMPRSIARRPSHPRRTRNREDRALRIAAQELSGRIRCRISYVHLEKMMKKLIAMASVVTAALGCAVSGAASAQNSAGLYNPLGFYLGLGVGESTVRSDNNYLYGFNDFNGYYGGPYDYSHHFAWKAAAGIRPISVVGAEFEYFDFGHPGSDTTYYYNNFNYGPDSHPRAIALFGVGYLPLPVPFLDVYGKAGIARLHTNVNGFDGQICVDPAPQCGTPTTQDRWDNRFAYGVGVQTHFSALGVRAEYERINSPYGDPDMFTVGVTWTF